MRNRESIKVININKNGEQFDPASYKVPYEGNKEIYHGLMALTGRIKNESHHSV